jgi:hypothetical protein
MHRWRIRLSGSPVPRAWRRPAGSATRAGRPALSGHKLYAPFGIGALVVTPARWASGRPSFKEAARSTSSCPTVDRVGGAAVAAQHAIVTDGPRARYPCDPDLDEYVPPRDDAVGRTGEGPA